MATHRWTSDAEIEISIAAARRDAALGNVAHKHHHVPRMYLKRWAADSGAVTLTKMDTGASYEQKPENFGYKKNFYRVAADDIDPLALPEMWFEKHMSRIEGEATAWLSDADAHALGRISDPELIGNLSVFLGLQSQRTVKQRRGELDIDAQLDRFGRRETVSKYLPILCAVKKIPYSVSAHDAIVEEMLAVPLVSSDPKPKAIESAINVWKKDMVPYLNDARTWWLYEADGPLATCDEPIVQIGGPLRERSAGHGMATAALLLFALSPRRLLVLARRDFAPAAPFILSAEETKAVNFEIASSSFEFVYERPGSKIAENISVPPLPPQEPELADNFWDAVVPRHRWSNCEGPSWPIPRWYRAASRH